MRPLLPSVGILALFAALSVAWTWPLTTHLGSRVAFDPGDPFLNTWILWWNAQAVPLSAAWWDAPIFYPMRGALALSEHLAGIGFFTTPMLRLGASPVLAYNAALLLSYTLSGFFTYALARRLSGSVLAGLCAGLAYGFAPYRAGQLPHLQVLTSQWLPLQLLALHAYLDSAQRRWLLLFALAWALQGLSNGYYLLFAPILLGAWVLWFVIAHRRWLAAGEIAAACLLASAPLIPAVVTYRRVHDALGLVRSRAEMLDFSATWQSLLDPPAMLAFWEPRQAIASEDALFPGLTIIAIVVVALLVIIGRRLARMDVRSAPVFLFYVCAALLMAALTLGPAAPGDGALGWLKPYQWLVHLPGFDGLRVPARFAMLMALCLAVAGGIGLAMILPVGRIPRALVGAAVALAVAGDGWIEPIGLITLPGRVELPQIAAAAVLELPPDDLKVNLDAMVRAMSHRRPLLNGFSGYNPRHFAILGQSLRRDDPSGITYLARGRPLIMLVAHQNDPAGDFRRLIESIPGVIPGEITAAGQTYLLAAQPLHHAPRGGSSYPFTVTRLPRSHVTLDLAAPRVVRVVAFELGDRYEELGRQLAIETSTDGLEWKMQWMEWTGGPAIVAALDDQVRVPVRLVLPDVTARYLRIHPVEEWLIKDLRVLGP